MRKATDSILALDPGETTGWAVFRGADLEASGEMPYGLMGFLRQYRLLPDHEVIVVEDFVAEPNFVGRPTPSEIIGAVTALSSHRTVFRQARSRKATITGGNLTESQRFAWLRERGFSGSSHELDAITHALIFLKHGRDSHALKKYWDIG